MSDTEPDGFENATHNTFPKNIQLFLGNVLWVAFSIPVFSLLQADFFFNFWRNCVAKLFPK
jgi:hypothetical protein